jgi:large conductance mechanosensitive channel
MAAQVADRRGETTMLREFKDFLFRGNIIELAVAFVVGLAFAALVNSLVENLLMPVIAMIIGKPDFSDLTFTINDAVFRYGAFLTDAIQFLAIAAAVFFFVVKPVQTMLARTRRTSVEEGMPDEERRHQELLAALRRAS